MRSPTWLRLRWPHEVTADQVRAGLLAIHGLSTPRRRDAFALQVFGDAQGVHHRLGVPAERQEAVTRALRQALPGISVDVDELAAGSDRTRWNIWLSTRRRPLRTADASIISSGLLAALAGLAGDEVVELTWVVGPVRRPIAVPIKTRADRTHSATAVLTALATGAEQLDSEERTALVRKQGEPGWRAAGEITVRAGSQERRHQLLQRLSGALRVSQGPGVQLGLRRAWLDRRSALPWRRPLALNVEELVGLSAWPIDTADALPIDRIASRLLPVPRQVPRVGRVLGVAADRGDGRPVAVSVRDSHSHLSITGPTGSGKSWLLANLAVQDMAAGRSMVVVDPKGDLVETLLNYVPEERRDDVVVLDVADDQRVVGFNPMSGSRQNPELVADQLLSLFKDLSGDAWGPRIGDVLHAALLTIAMQPDATLCTLPILLSDAGYRRRALTKIDDPFGLGPFWRSFDGLNESERQQTIAPVMRRLRQLLLRPRLRAVLGQTAPRFQIDQVLTQRKILLVSLAKGLIGPAGSSLVGSLVVNALWQALLGRAALPPERRHPVMVYIDEIQEHVRGVTDLAEMFALARSHGAPLHVAHQHLAQLEPALRSAIAANARSRVVFQTSAEDAAVFTRGQRTLRPEDFQRLPRYHAYASLLAEGSVTPYLSLRTLPLGEPISDPRALRAHSRERYGVDREQVEAELRALLDGAQHVPEAPLGGRRRRT